jgi:hypothetical protein
MTSSSLARNPICLLLVPYETPQPYKTSPSDAVPPGNIHEPFLLNDLLQENPEALVKKINLP